MTSHRGVVIGYGARRKSELFALDTAYVLAARGIRSMVFSSVVPTPVLAWSITELGAASGVMVTASHNPPTDNGYKVYLDSGAQIVNPIDEEIATCIADIDPLTVELAEPDSALVTMLDDELRQRYLSAVGNVLHAADTEPIRVAYAPLHGVGATLVEAFAHCGLGIPEIVEEQFEPDGSFPTVPFPNQKKSERWMR